MSRACVAGERRRPTRAETRNPPIDKLTLSAELRELVAPRLLQVVGRVEPPVVTLWGLYTIEIACEN